VGEYVVKRAFKCRISGEHYNKGAAFPCDDAQRVAELQEKGHLGDKAHQGPGPEDIKSLGGGHYQLPNGEKVRGKEEALKKLEELQIPPAEGAAGDPKDPPAAE
jgi:hypothetical protein